MNALGYKRPVCRLCLQAKSLEEFRKKPSSGAYTKVCLECEASGAKAYTPTAEQMKSARVTRDRLAEVVEWRTYEGPGLHYLYRLEDDSGELLYVGVSKSPYNRMDIHLRTKSIYKMVIVESFATRSECLLAEKESIALLNPPLNVRHTSKVTAW